MSGRPWYSDFSVGEKREEYIREQEKDTEGGVEKIRRGVGWENQHFMGPSLVELLHCNVN